MHDTGHKTDINTRLIRLVDIFVLNTKSSSCGIHYLIALNVPNRLRISIDYN